MGGNEGPVGNSPETCANCVDIGVGKVLAPRVQAHSLSMESERGASSQRADGPRSGSENRGSDHHSLGSGGGPEGRSSKAKKLMTL